MGRKSLKDQRRKEIVKVFYQVAKKEGLENTSFAKIAKIMEINPSLIIHYFSTRNELLIALNEFILESYQKMFSNKTNVNIATSQDLIALIESLFSRKWNRLFDDGVFYSCYALTFRNPTFRQNFKQMHEILHNFLSEILETSKSAGIIYNENIAELTDTIFALIDGAYYYLGMIDDKKELEKKTAIYARSAVHLLEFEETFVY